MQFGGAVAFCLFFSTEEVILWAGDIEKLTK